MAEHLERAELLLGLDRWKEAEREVRSHLASHPEDPEGHRTLVQCLLPDGRLDEALDAARIAVASAPDGAINHAILGQVLTARGDLSGARRACDEAVRLDPGEAAFREMQGELRLAAGDPGSALTAAIEGLKLDAASTGLHLLRGRALWKLDRRREAEKSFESALKLDPESADAHAELAAAIAYRGVQGRALEHFRAALRLDPDHRPALIGVLDALKSRHPLYAVVLMMANRRSEEVRIGGLDPGIVLGLVGAIAVRIATWNHELMWWHSLLLAGWAIILIVVGMGSLAEPLFDLGLNASREGRRILPEERIRSAHATGICVLLAAILACIAFATASASHMVALTLVVMLAPGVRAAYLEPSQRGRVRTLAIVLVIALIGGAGAALLQVEGLRVIGGAVVVVTSLAGFVFGLWRTIRAEE